MKKTIVLVQPKNTLFSNIYPPLNLIQLGSIIKKQGFDVIIITCPTEKNHIDRILNACENALLIGISILTPEVPDAIEIAEHLRRNVKLPIVWGGWHATLFADQIAKSTLADKVIVDEGEELIIQAIREFSENKCEQNGGNKILKNHSKLNMDLLPFPDYSLVSNIEFYICSKLSDKFLEYENRAIRWLPYQASRGCPGRCKFCINVVTQNSHWRNKSAEKVVLEIEAITKRYNLNHIKLVDDNFFVNTKWVKQIAQELINKKLGVTWDAECRADYVMDNKVSDELLNLCKRAGLVLLTFGIESGSQSTLDRMGKGVNIDQNYYAVKKATEHGIVCRCSFILDIPGDTAEDILCTASFINKIRKLPRTSCGVHTFRPYPKSELCENLLQDNIIKQPDTFEGWADENFVALFTYTDAKRTWQKNFNLSNKISFYQNLESGFWLRPHQIENGLIRSINTVFMKFAFFRNRLLFYSCCIDRTLYVLFRETYFKMRNRKTLDEE